MTLKTPGRKLHCKQLLLSKQIGHLPFSLYIILKPTAWIQNTKWYKICFRCIKEVHVYIGIKKLLKHKKNLLNFLRALREREREERYREIEKDKEIGGKGGKGGREN